MPQGLQINAQVSMPQGLVIFKIQWHRGQTKAKCKLIDLDGGLGWVG
jgi:hypothetical protein